MPRQLNVQSIQKEEMSNGAIKIIITKTTGTDRVEEILKDNEQANLWLKSNGYID